MESKCGNPSAGHEARSPASGLGDWPSADTAHHLITDQGVDARKGQCLPWGLDPEFEARLAAPHQTALPRGFPECAQIILTVSRWDPADRYKGGDTLIAALLQAVPEAFLVLVGGGKDRPRLEQLAQDLGISDHTRFLHALTQDELFACYSNCELFVLPSRGEGFGLVYLEAMAYGKRVIGGADGGALDLIEDGVTGWLVPHGDIDRLRAALEFLLANPRRAAEMGARGKDRLARKFSFEQSRTQLAHLLDDVITRSYLINGFRPLQMNELVAVGARNPFVSWVSVFPTLGLLEWYVRFSYL
jgi:glycosyltransferase involved in cell wall biosynthesis